MRLRSHPAQTSNWLDVGPLMGRLLQSLLLSNLYYLEKWRVEEGAMPSLCRLEIEFCCRLKMVPNGLRFITTLQELEIKQMTSFKDRLNEGGPDFDKVKHVRSLVF